MKRFNIRVYGILINSDKEVLLADERRHEHHFTKFPGGGLEWGEGLEDAIKREWKEELNCEVKIESLFYVNDFFQLSVFSENDQIISFYFLISTIQWDQIDKAIEMCAEDQQENFRWKKITELKDDEFTFPIDKIVANQLTKTLPTHFR